MNLKQLKYVGKNSNKKIDTNKSSKITEPFYYIMKNEYIKEEMMEPGLAKQVEQNPEITI